MPKFFVDTFDGRAVFDDEGYELSNQIEAKDLVQRVLCDLMSCEKVDHHGARLRADVRNEAGALVMTARLVLTIDEFRSHL